VVNLKFGGKEFNYYWQFIKYPLTVYILWIVAGFIVSLYSYSTYLSVFGQIPGTVVMVATMVIPGYLAVADFKGSVKHSAWGSALIGVFVGFLAAIVGILMAYFVPEIIQASVSAAVEQGAEPEMISKFVMIGMYINLVIGPLIYGAVGAIIGAAGGGIARFMNKH